MKAQKHSMRGPSGRRVVLCEAHLRASYEMDRMLGSKGQPTYERLGLADEDEECDICRIPWPTEAEVAES
jgi:hypothetical protein